MTLQDIMERLVEDGFTCHFSGSKQIIVIGHGEVELAYGEAKIFDSKYPWPGYGDHECHKNLESLFEDIHKTWPKETSCETLSVKSSTSTAQLQAVEETATKDVGPAPATEESHD